MRPDNESVIEKFEPTFRFEMKVIERSNPKFIFPGTELYHHTFCQLKMFTNKFKWCL
jgi:hypothetical protein